MWPELASLSHFRNQGKIYEYLIECLAHEGLRAYFFPVSHFRFLDFSKNSPKWNNGWVFSWCFEFNLLIPPPPFCFCLPQGYAFLLFQEESSVQALIDACLEEDGKLYLCVSSPTIKDKPVSNVQPAVAFPEHVCNQPLFLSIELSVGWSTPLPGGSQGPSWEEPTQDRRQGLYSCSVIWHVPWS